MSHATTFTKVVKGSIHPSSKITRNKPSWRQLAFYQGVFAMERICKFVGNAALNIRLKMIRLMYSTDSFRRLFSSTFVLNRNVKREGGRVKSQSAVSRRNISLTVHYLDISFAVV